MKHTKNMIYNQSWRADDLYLFTVNTGYIYRGYTTGIIETLRKHAKRGQYSPEKAVDMFYTLAGIGNKYYIKEFGGDGFTVTERWTAAVDMENHYRENIMEG